MTTRKEKKKRAVRNLTRRQRRKEYRTMVVTFLLTGGHKDYVPAFSHNWKLILSYQTNSIESGNVYYTQPRKQHDSFSYTTTPREHSKSLWDMLNPHRTQTL